jgi:bacillithiol biosynthesis deacetylase BshB1
MFDAMFLGAHPDDVEILAGGLVARMAAEGRRIAIVDATRGEGSSRGTVEERRQEAADAARILGVERFNLDLPDGALSHDVPAVTRRVVEAIRAHKPRLVFTHEAGDHHPDHNALSLATKYATFQANVVRYDTGQERHAVKALYYYVGYRKRWPAEPSFVADITDHFALKLEALRAFRSQLANPAYDGPETFVSSQLAWDLVEARAGFFGGMIGVRYGEPFKADAPLRIDDPLTLPGN